MQTLTPEKERLARMLKALGNPVRFQIVEFLARNQTCITNDIVRNTPLAQSTVSQHLKVLREAGLIQGEIEGPATCYCLDPEGLRWLKEHFEGWLPDYQVCCPPTNRRIKTDDVK
ncbi:MAG TPA: metalloregulator ArsR/SmtB family transcription factor [Anaerolineales bacterium]|nr:metalloregulator ArsR/SmtB family transcription factor [Anaerolineales bacterium]